MNIAALYIVLSRVGFRNTKTITEQPSGTQEILTARPGA
jgi:hypothetical protein